MKDYIKKIIFVCSGLFVIVGTFVLYRVENVDASTAPKKYGAWTLNCTLNNEKKNNFAFYRNKLIILKKIRKKKY